MKITDCHAHIFPAKIAEKATLGIGKFYDVDMKYIGSSETLLEKGRAAGITQYWVHSVATTPHQIRAINEFIAEQCAIHPEFIGFGSLHPDAEDIEAEVENIISLGLKGVKLHPDFQLFNIDDEKALPMYECFAGRLPLIIHTGDNRYSWSHPARLARVLKMFPKLDCVAAHFGGYTVWDEAYDLLKDTQCVVDTSSTTGMMNDYEHLRRIADMWGTDRMLFGSDFPMWDHSEELERVAKLGLKGDALEDVMWRNAERFMAKYQKK